MGAKTQYTSADVLRWKGDGDPIPYCRLTRLKKDVHVFYSVLNLITCIEIKVE
jgi:hypothetical protein